MKKCFIMGLPEAGKTTYMAALWYVLLNSNNSSLKVNKLVGDQTYLVEISKKWANVVEIPRTLPASEKIVNVQLTNSENKVMTLVIPDFSGESFQMQYVNRVIKNEHAEFMRDSVGVFLFLNVNNIKESFLISKISAQIRKDETTVNEIVENKIRSPKDDDSTQAQLVDLLQFIGYLKDSQSLRLCVIISAWDLLTNTQQNHKPEELIQKKMPLLWQYIKSNSNILEVTYYGISALGGRLEEKERLLEFINPCERIKVVDKDGNISNDITLPINWMMGNFNE